LTILALRWRAPAPPIVTRWRCPDPRIVERWRGLDDAAAESASQRADPMPIAALIGPPGLGGEGEASTIVREAGEALGGHRAISVGVSGLALYADPFDPLLRVPAGVSIGAAAGGDTVTVQIAGELVEPSWSWTPGPIYLAPLGMLTQAPPVSGAIVIVGQATGPSAMRIGPQLVALLN
jgi:hypothetical protein